MSAPSAALSQRISYELLRQLHAAHAHSGVGALTVVTLFWVLFYWQLRDRWVLAWALLLYLNVVVVFLWYARFGVDARRPVPRPPAYWLRRFHAVQAFAGLSWGIAPWLFAAQDNLPVNAVLVVAVMGLASASQGTLSFVRHGMTSFALPMMLCLAVALLRQPDPLHGVLAFFVLLHLLLSIKLSSDHHQLMVEALRARFDNEALAERLGAQVVATERASQEKTRFLATASHDLRQPVHAMSLMVEAISLRNADPSLQPLVADLRNSMQAMSQLFNALLNLSRLESGQPLGAKGAVDLSALLADMVRLFREQASLGGLALRLRLPRGGATVWAEPVLLRQALTNLVQNAIRYTPQGKVLVSVRARGSDWLVEVRDTGIGIAVADQHRVFKPYYRGAQAAPMDDAGHGLGLAVVARCAEQMGAAYGLQSHAGRGSCFWLRLPNHAARASADTPDPTPARRDAIAAQPLQGCCLVLDDDPQVLKAWRAMLDAWGVAAAYAATGAEAHAQLDDGFAPDAIFCDQRLRSGDSGFDVLRALLARCPAAHGAMVSGEFDAPALRDAEDEGYLVLRKPVNPAELHAVLAQWLA